MQKKPLIDSKVNMIHYDVIIFSVSNLNLLLLKRHKVVRSLWNIPLPHSSRIPTHHWGVINHFKVLHNVLNTKFFYQTRKILSSLDSLFSVSPPLRTGLQSLKASFLSSLACLIGISQYKATRRVYFAVTIFVWARITRANLLEKEILWQIPRHPLGDSIKCH